MQKYRAHGATTVGGYGILGHVERMAKEQKSDVAFLIHTLPVISNMVAVSESCGIMLCRKSDHQSRRWFGHDYT